MRLSLGSAPVTSSGTKRHVTRALDILQEVQESVHELGLVDYPKPESAPPALTELDVGSLPNSELETYYTRYVAHAQYVSQKFAVTSAAEKIAKSNMKSILASVKLNLLKNGTPKVELDVRAQESAEYMEYEIEYLKLYATKEILEAHYEAYSKQAAALSRIVEIRKLEFEQSLRQSNVGNYRAKAGARRAEQEGPRGFRR